MRCTRSLAQYVLWNGGAMKFFGAPSRGRLRGKHKHPREITFHSSTQARALAGSHQDALIHKNCHRLRYLSSTPVTSRASSASVAIACERLPESLIPSASSDGRCKVTRSWSNVENKHWRGWSPSTEACPGNSVIRTRHK
jgi:hypothetical protein